MVGFISQIQNCVKSEIVQKLTYGVDQMFIEEGMESEEVEGHEEVEYFELVAWSSARFSGSLQIPHPTEEKSSNKNNIFFAGKK